MKFEETGIEKVTIDINRLEEVMEKNHLTRDEHWDYKKITYDRKLPFEGNTYYLRVQGTAADGDVGTSNADIKLLPPLLAKHYFPHGVYYGDEEVFPDKLIAKCNEILTSVKAELDEF